MTAAGWGADGRPGEKRTTSTGVQRAAGRGVGGGERDRQRRRSKAVAADEEPNRPLVEGPDPKTTSLMWESPRAGTLESTGPPGGWRPSIWSDARRGGRRIRVQTTRSAGSFRLRSRTRRTSCGLRGRQASQPWGGGGGRSCCPTLGPGRTRGPAGRDRETARD